MSISSVFLLNGSFIYFSFIQDTSCQVTGIPLHDQALHSIQILLVTKQQFLLDLSPYHVRWKEREEHQEAKLKKMLKHASDDATLSSLEQGIAAKQSKMSDVKANDSPFTEKTDPDSAFTNSLDPPPYEASTEQWIAWVESISANSSRHRTNWGDWNSSKWHCKGCVITKRGETCPQEA